MFCSRCGATVLEGNRFCQACGQQVGAAVITAPAPASGPTSSVVASAPSQAALPYAGFWRRFAAYLIDGVILGIPFGIIWLVLVFMFGGLGVLLHRTAPMEPGQAAALLGPMFLMFGLLMLVFVAVQWLYFAGMESSARQATFGKAAMSMRVTNYDGQRISFGHATGRFFAKIVTSLIPLFIGWLMAAFTERKQALHDMIAGTLVLKG